MIIGSPILSSASKHSRNENKKDSNFSKRTENTKAHARFCAKFIKCRWHREHTSYTRPERNKPTPKTVIQNLMSDPKVTCAVVLPVQLEE